MERQKLELQLNEPKTVELLFDQCIVGENRYGEYYLYALADTSTGEELSFFAPDDAHKQLKEFGQGDQVKITKTAEQKGKKVFVKYNVEGLNPNGSASGEKTGNGSTPPKANGSHPANGNGKPSHEIHDEGRFYTEMLASFEDAAKIQRKLNGADLNRIAITLFIARTKVPNGHSSYA
ncbi:MAG: hypothetical protein CL946_10940 [Ectothiorhodospiraceae bacterium]|nr:hypothetical protein [Ectothiorhodospiraceae bacterium]